MGRLRACLIPPHAALFPQLHVSIGSRFGASIGSHREPDVGAILAKPCKSDAQRTWASVPPATRRSFSTVVFSACTVFESLCLEGAAVSRRGLAIARDMTEDEYNNIANELLDDLLDKLEVIEDSMDGFEVNSSGDGVIHVTMADKGTWVLNKQTPSRQIWLSSPITGPTHYRMVDNEVMTLSRTSCDKPCDSRILTILSLDCQWICTKDGHKMVDRLKQQLYIEL